MGSAATGAGKRFLCLSKSKSRGVAILFRTTAKTSNLTCTQHSTKRTHAVSELHFRWPTLHGRVRARSLIVFRSAALQAGLLPSIPGDRHLLLVGGDFSCIVGQQDVPDPASPPRQTTLGYWTGLRHVETDN